MKKINKFRISLALALAFAVGITALAWAGTLTRIPFGLMFHQDSAPGTPGSDYGSLYVADSSGTMTLYFKDDQGAATNLISAGTGNTLDQAYDEGGAGVGRTITASGGAVKITNTDADAAFILEVDANAIASAALGGIYISSTASCSQDCLQIANSGTGDDIQAGGGSFKVDGSGNVTCANLTPSGSLYQPAISSAASGNTNLTIDAAGTGTITFGTTSTGLASFTRQVNMLGDVNIGNAATDTLTITSIIDGAVTLDDGTTDSPSLILKDATDETATLVKSDGDNLTCTTTATEGLEIVTGNLWVGNGSPGTASMDGEDFYVNGDSEFDGSIQADGAVTFAGTVSLTANTTATLGAAEYIQIDAATTDQTGTAGALDVNFDSKTTGAEGANIKATFVAGGGGSEVVAGQVIDLDDDSDAAGTLVGLDINSSDATGSSDVIGIRLGSSLEDQISSTVGAANQALVIDAATADNTNTSGVIDIAYDTITNGCAGINLDMAMGDAGAGVTAHGILIDMDDDTSSNAATINGFSATSADLTGQATTVVRGFYTSGCDAAFQADNGYVRIGTGSTPGVTPGDDDLFVEGTIEVDGNFYPDGSIIGDGATEMVGVKHDVIDGADGTPYTVTIAMAGTVFYNSQAIQFNLPEASTAIGTEYTFAVAHASNLDINPADADQIIGLTNAVGDMIRSATVADTVTLVAINATNWIVKSIFPAYTDWADAN